MVLNHVIRVCMQTKLFTPDFGKSTWYKKSMVLREGCSEGKFYFSTAPKSRVNFVVFAATHEAAQ